MFTNYRIEKIGEEDVLFLQLNFDFEFATFQQWKENSKNLIDQVKQYLKERQIQFRGKLIHLIINGIVIGSIILTPSLLEPRQEIVHVNDSYEYVSKVYIPDYIEQSSPSSLEDDIEIIEDIPLENAPSFDQVETPTISKEIQKTTPHTTPPSHSS